MAAAIDNFTSGTAIVSGNSASTSFAVGAVSNRTLVVYLAGYANSNSPTVTYAGVSMTQVDNVSQVSGGAGTSTWILVAPATGTNTLAFGSMTNGFRAQWTVHSFQGTAQVSQPDNHQGSQYSGTATPGLTPTQAGCIFWAAGYGDGGNGSFSISGVPNDQATNYTFSNPVFLKIAGGDNGVVAASSQSASFADAGGTRMVGMCMSIAPAPAPKNSNFFTFF